MSHENKKSFFFESFLWFTIINIFFFGMWSSLILIFLWIQFSLHKSHVELVEKATALLSFFEATREFNFFFLYQNVFFFFQNLGIFFSLSTKKLLLLLLSGQKERYCSLLDLMAISLLILWMLIVLTLKTFSSFFHFFCCGWGIIIYLYRKKWDDLFSFLSFLLIFKFFFLIFKKIYFSCISDSKL